MTRSTIALKLALLLFPVLSLAAQAQSAITEQEAHAIGVDAYIYFYPLVTMDVTRKQLTNVEPGKGIGAPGSRGIVCDAHAPRSLLIPCGNHRVQFRRSVAAGQAHP